MKTVWRLLACVADGIVEKILVIEDDRATRKALKQLFETEGFSVVSAESGAEGIAMFRGSRPNFVILDLRLPEVGGQDVCRRIRKESEDVPILILSGSADEVDRVLLLELGADAYVIKPFSPKEVWARVRAVLRRARRTMNVEQLRFDEVSIDFLKMDATKGG